MSKFSIKLAALLAGLLSAVALEAQEVKGTVKDANGDVNPADAAYL